MMLSRRNKVLLFTGLSILALAILAASLTGMKLRPGLPFSFIINPPAEEVSGSLPGGEFFLRIFRVIYLFSLLLLPISIIYLILSPEARKEFLRKLLQFTPFLFIFLFVSTVFKINPDALQLPDAAEGGSMFPPYPVDQAPVESFSDQVPAWLIILTSLLVSLVLLSIIILVIRSLRKRESSLDRPLVEIGQEAQQALDALALGSDLKNVVIRCYFQMNKIITQQRGIVREEAMTPREFVQALEEKGLPHDPVRTLTQLFEAARYGVMAPGKGDENQAIASLTAIADFCREAR
jgi:hypothetical protein